MRAPAAVLAAFYIILALAAAPGVAAQDWLLAPSYGEVELFAGFSDDPYTVELVAGGSVNLGSRGLRGRVAEAPDFDLWYEAGSFPLTITVDRAHGNTVLLVNDPTGRWHFAERSGGREPRIVFRNPASGLYNIWVGTVRDEFISARLVITEY